MDIYTSCCFPAQSGLFLNVPIIGKINTYACTLDLFLLSRGRDNASPLPSDPRHFYFYFFSRVISEMMVRVR